MLDPEDNETSTPIKYVDDNTAKSDAVNDNVANSNVDDNVLSEMITPINNSGPEDGDDLDIIDSDAELSEVVDDAANSLNVVNDNTSNSNVNYNASKSNAVDDNASKLNAVDDNASNSNAVDNDTISKYKKICRLCLFC